MLHPPHVVATLLKNQGEAKLSQAFIGTEKIPQLSVSDKLTKGVFKYSDSGIKHSSSLPLTTEQQESWNNSDNARFAGTSFLSSLFLADPYALITLHCTLPVFLLYTLVNFCFSLKLPGQNYWEGNLTIPSYREKKHSTEPFYVIKWAQPLVIKGENQHLPGEFRVGPSWRSQGSWGALRAGLSDTARQTCWLAGADGGLLFLHNVIPLSPMPPAPGATWAALPRLWQEQC